MRPSPWLAAALLAALAGATPAQEERCCGVKELAASGKAAGEWGERSGPVRPWADYNRNIRWYESIEEGQRQAVAQGKMLFTLQIVGNLKDEGC